MTSRFRGLTENTKASPAKSGWGPKPVAPRTWVYVTPLSWCRVCHHNNKATAVIGMRAANLKMQPLKKPCYSSARYFVEVLFADSHFRSETSPIILRLMKGIGNKRPPQRNAGLTIMPSRRT
ncbi:hypothetical protein TNCV_4807211 [Trichonephila clavipes]|nr:hypothetical protein TNCV_4807211 [Trichonephila clavipes]